MTSKISLRLYIYKKISLCRTVQRVYTSQDLYLPVLSAMFQMKYPPLNARNLLQSISILVHNRSRANDMVPDKLLARNPPAHKVYSAHLTHLFTVPFH